MRALPFLEDAACIHRTWLAILAMIWCFSLLTGCASKQPSRTGTTQALSGSLQRQAQAADAAQTASREVGTHLQRMQLSRVDGKAEVVLEYLRRQP